VYYSAQSPISEVLRSFPAKRVGAVGLGVGVSCADARAGTSWTFYELDPDVVDIARRFFTFLPKCRADVQVRTGDARLLLGDEPPGRFDLLYLDAFSGGSVPFHLLTQEAIQLYRSRLRPGGVMIFHVSANFLDIVPVVRLGTSAVGLQSLVKRVSFDPEDPARLSSEWLVATTDPGILRRLSKNGWQKPEVPAGWKVWTDDYRNVLKAIKL
jgi:SAM-dependent methyltransferase